MANIFAFILVLTKFKGGGKQTKYSHIRFICNSVSVCHNLKYYAVGTKHTCKVVTNNGINKWSKIKFQFEIIKRVAQHYFYCILIATINFNLGFKNNNIELFECVYLCQLEIYGLFWNFIWRVYWNFRQKCKLQFLFVHLMVLIMLSILRIGLDFWFSN
jgi:hypothetical protein